MNAPDPTSMTTYIPLPEKEGAAAAPPGGSMVEAYLALGRLLFKSGASTQRIIDSIAHVGRRFGDHRELHVLVTYDAIVVSATSGETHRMKMDQAKGFAGVNVAALLGVSRLTRGLPRSAPTPAAFCEEVERISKIGHLYGLTALAFAAAIANIGFGLLNGADVPALTAIAPAAIWVFLLRTFLLRRDFNLYAATLLAVWSGGLMAALLSNWARTTTPEAAFIAPMLFLVPGLPFINGGVDIIRNHNSMGVARVTFTAMVVATITLGLALAMPLCPLPSSTAAAYAGGWLSKCLGNAGWAAMAAVGLAMLNNATVRTLPAFALCGAVARLGRELCVHFGADPVTGSLAGTALCAALAILMERRFTVPAYIFAVVGVLPMVPGLFAIKGLEGIFQIAASQGSPDPALVASAFQMFLKAFFISCALVGGIIFPIMFADRTKPRI